MRVSGQSMAPILKAGELVLVDERAYGRRAPRRGEVVAATPSALDGMPIVKRLAGLPYDQVILGGRRRLLGEDQFFLLGDHAGHSVDSRTFGPVCLAELMGPTPLRVWPWGML